MYVKTFEDFKLSDFQHGYTICYADGEPIWDTWYKTPIDKENEQLLFDETREEFNIPQDIKLIIKPANKKSQENFDIVANDMKQNNTWDEQCQNH